MFRRFLVLFLILTTSAIAAQDSTVVIDNAPVVAEPKTSARIIEYMPIGTEIRISSYPIEGGWYKVRAKNGEYGWVHESYLSVEKVAMGDEEGEDGLDGKKKKPVPAPDTKWFVRGMFGYSFFAPADLNDIFAFDELSIGNHFGAEVGYQWFKRMAVVLRGEWLYKDVVAKETSTAVTYSLSLRSYPIMAGLDFFLLQMPAMRLSFGVFGGIAAETSFASEALSLPKPNELVLKSAPITGYARVNLTRPLGRMFSIFVEAGYRYLKTDKIGTSSAVATNGGQIYIKNNVFKSREIDLSGPVASVGLGFHF